MYNSFKFVLFDESFPNPVKFEIRPNFGRSRSRSRTPVQP